MKAGSGLVVATTVERDNTGPAITEILKGFAGLTTLPVAQDEVDRTVTVYRRALAGSAETSAGLFGVADRRRRHRLDAGGPAEPHDGAHPADARRGAETGAGAVVARSVADRGGGRPGCGDAAACGDRPQGCARSSSERRCRSRRPRCGRSTSSAASGRRRCPPRHGGSAMAARRGRCMPATAARIAARSIHAE